MKGPGVRLNLDVRRIWECPQCGKQRKAGGETVVVRCGCAGEPVEMKLVEPQRLPRSFADVIDRVRQASSAAEQSPANNSSNGDP